MTNPARRYSTFIKPLPVKDADREEIARLTAVYLRTKEIDRLPDPEPKPFRETPRRPLPDDETFKRQPTKAKVKQRNEADRFREPGTLTMLESLEYLQKKHNFPFELDYFRVLILNGRGPEISSAHPGSNNRIYRYFKIAALDLFGNAKSWEAKR